MSVNSDGKINKKQKDFLEFKITAKEIKNKKINTFSKFIEILTSCFKDYKKTGIFSISGKSYTLVRSFLKNILLPVII